MDEISLRVKDWSHFQHFKDRSPPWIKLYREILDDPDWHELDGESAKNLIMLWLMASEDKTKQGLLPKSIKKIAFRLRITETKAKQILNKLSDWLIQDDISVISEGYQVDAPEERRGETETERNKGRFTPPSLKEVEDYCRERNNDVDAQKFMDHYEANGWMRGKNKIKSWKACVRTWETKRSKQEEWI